MAIIQDLRQPTSKNFLDITALVMVGVLLNDDIIMCIQGIYILVDLNQ